MWEIAVHLAVACDVYDGVFLCCSFYPRGVLDEILNLIESVSGGFPSCFCLFLETAEFNGFFFYTYEHLIYHVQLS